MREVILYQAVLAEGTHAAQHAAGRVLLARALRDARLDPALPVQTGAHGKPYLPGAPGFHFSIAHCGARVICAVADCPVGADLERERPLRRDIAPKICTPAEREAVRGPSDLFALWTGKEAAVKAVGLGFALPPRAVEVGLDEARALSVGGTPCFLRRLPPEDGWHLAVCLTGGKEFRFHLISPIA